ncbi:DUF4394 domain-containing protein [Nakamurella leprariae]|uniref:DUF4394 domain-containing protein n=1 Tax=Nakamurella leprariae TaxID=2803911 RepID=A0A938YHG5_9ACTN|nr:DUF4394 domain-containing protein [Nakamurella leprariae]MBM9467898.1 DUF4394 domain-containing protein [Nakamurella leprariae]
MRMRTLGTTGMLAAILAAGLALPSAATAAPATAGRTAEVSTNALAGVGGSVQTALFGKGDQHSRGKSGGLSAVGLTDGGRALVVFSVDKPGRTGQPMTVTGLAGDRILIGIDHRVQNGKLYAVGNAGGIYLIGDRAAAAKVGQLSVALSGTQFGVDFNPAANALRVVSDTGQNLRQPFGTGDAPNGATVADTPLSNAGAPATGISAAAYTNNDLSAATATTLFDLDTVADQVVLQSPANAGTLVPTGSYGVDADRDAGFDIYSTLRDDRAVENTGFATITIKGRSTLVEIDLLTGSAESKGVFSQRIVTDIAVLLNQRGR